MVAFGMGWTYIVMLVAAVLQDLGLTIADWGPFLLPTLSDRVVLQIFTASLT
jgi:hypothetical protein